MFTMEGIIKIIYSRPLILYMMTLREVANLPRAPKLIAETEDAKETNGGHKFKETRQWLVFCFHILGIL